MTWHCHIFAVLALAFSACFHQGLASAINVTEPVPVAGQVCESSQCRVSAAVMKRKMNTSANPCENFNEFACGNYINGKDFETGRTLRSSFTELYNENFATLTNIILEDTVPSDPKYRLKMKQFYQSCMDEAQIEVVGLGPYFQDRTFIDDWPTLNPSWTGANFDLNEVIARYMAAGVEPIFSISVGTDLNGTANNVIFLSHGSQEMSEGEKRNDSLIMAYEKYLTKTAIALNASREVAERDARDVVDLEIALSNNDYSMEVNPVSLGNVNSVTDKLDIARAVRATFDTANMALADNERIINLYPTYMKNLPSVLGRFSNRTIQNLFGFQYALLRVGDLTRRTRDIWQDFRRVIIGAPTEPPRTAVCYHKTSEAFSKALSKQFILRRFHEGTKVHVNDIIDNVTKDVHEIIQEAPWMSNQTKVVAFEKLASLRRYIGYPDEDFEEADIDRLYDNYTMHEKEYYNNFAIFVKQARLQQLKTLRQPSSKNQWPIAPHEVDAFYEVYRNSLTVLAGILQPPLFAEYHNHFLNYGSMGFIIARKLTQIVDDAGSHFDKDGNLREWWTEEDHQKYRNRSQCIIDQNSRINVVEANVTVDGQRTKSQTIADRGGLKIALRAYRGRVKQLGVEPTLPVLNLTQEQLFFLSFAQGFCQKWRPERLRTFMASEPHLPGKYRINGVLQNSEEFAKAYNCPVGSFMNPAEKCSVW